MGNAIFWVVILHFVISIGLFAYMEALWHFDKPYIFGNGWTLEWCTPVGELEIPLYFIPLVNLVFTYIALKLIEELMVQRNKGQVIDVYLWKFGIHYQETD